MYVIVWKRESAGDRHQTSSPDNVTVGYYNRISKEHCVDSENAFVYGYEYTQMGTQRDLLKQLDGVQEQNLNHLL